MFYSTKLMNFWHKNLHFVHNPSKLFKKGAAPPKYHTLQQHRHQHQNPDDHKDDQQLGQRKSPQRLPPKSVSIQDIRNSHVIFIKHSNEL